MSFLEMFVKIIAYVKNLNKKFENESLAFASSVANHSGINQDINFLVINRAKETSGRNYSSRHSHRGSSSRDSSRSRVSEPTNRARRNSPELREENTPIAEERTQSKPRQSSDKGFGIGTGVYVASSLRNVINKRKEIESGKAQATRIYSKETIYTSNDKVSIIGYKLKFIGLLILALGILMFLIGTFLNKNNPMIPLIKSIGSPLSITILGSSKTKLFDIQRTTEGVTTEKNVSPNLEKTFISLHALLELIHQERTIQAAEKGVSFDEVKFKRADIDSVVKRYVIYMQSPRGTPFSTYQAPKTLGEVVRDTLDSMFSVFEPSKQDEEAGINQDLTARNNSLIIKECKIFQVSSDMGNTHCEYSSINMMMNKLYTSSEGRFDKYTSPIKIYLLTNWLEKKVSFGSFLSMVFNITYYGNYQVGIKPSYYDYFNDPFPIDKMDIPHSLFMIDALYKYNKKYYPDYDISVENILDMLIAHEVVPADKKQLVLDKIEEIESGKVTRGYATSLFLNNFMNEAYKIIPERNNITIKTTLANSIQNSASGLLGRYLTRNNIPEGGVVILNGNNIMTSVAMKLIDKKAVFQSKYPSFNVYNALKPFLYLGLLSNKKDASVLLLNTNYQNLIFANRRINLLNHTTDKKDANLPEINENTLLSLQNANITSFPEGIKKKFADQLTYYEYNFFHNVDPIQYNAVLKKLGLLSGRSLTLEELLNGDNRVSLIKLATAYSAFSSGGELKNLKYIEDINGIAYKSGENILSIRKTYVNLLKDVYFNVVSSTSTNKDYYVLVDMQVAIAFNDDYTIVVWLGSQNPDNTQFNDTTAYTSLLLTNIINFLP